MEGDDHAVQSCGKTGNFNPLPPHGGRHGSSTVARQVHSISIHSLRMEGDYVKSMRYVVLFTFQSTPSAWRETFQNINTEFIIFHFNPLPPHGGRLCRDSPVRQAPGISIHSLRMEGDLPFLSFLSNFVYFNPLPPHGGRPEKSARKSAGKVISIHSLRMEGDRTASPHRIYNSISIHSLRMEGDQPIRRAFA